MIPYVELRGHTAFSFGDGATIPAALAVHPQRPRFNDPRYHGLAAGRCRAQPGAR